MRLLGKRRLVIVVVVVVVVVSAVESVNGGPRWNWGLDAIRRQEFRRLVPRIAHVGNSVHALFRRLPWLRVPPADAGVPGRLVDVRVLGLAARLAVLAARRVVRRVVAQGQQPSAVRLRVLVHAVVAPAHVDEELRPAGGGVRQPFLPPGVRLTGDHQYYDYGGGYTAGGRQGKIEECQAAPERALRQGDQRLAGELLVGADDVVGVQLEPGLVPQLLRPDHVPQPAHRAVADEGVAADAQGQQAVHGELHVVEGGEAAAAQGDPLQVPGAEENVERQLLQATVTVQRDPLEVHVVAERFRVHAEDRAVVQLEVPQLVQIAET